MSHARTSLAALTGALVAAAIVVAVGSMPACDPAGGTPSSPCACESAAPVVDASLLAFLSRARVLHREADAAEEAHDGARAIKALERITAGPVPGGATLPPEAREVLADTWARQAEIRGSLGDFDAAAKDVESGLKVVPEPNYFRGHLFEVLGGVEERRASVAEKAGDASTAKAARERALTAGEQAVKIQEEVINRVTKEGKGR